MSFSISSLIAGFFFGVWGVFLVRRARRESHLPSLIFGVALLVYPYFVENAYLVWGIGAVICFLAYKLANY